MAYPITLSPLLILTFLGYNFETIESAFSIKDNTKSAISLDLPEKRLPVAYV